MRGKGEGEGEEKDEVRRRMCIQCLSYYYLDRWEGSEGLTKAGGSGWNNGGHRGCPHPSVGLGVVLQPQEAGSPVTQSFQVDRQINHSQTSTDNQCIPAGTPLAFLSGGMASTSRAASACFNDARRNPLRGSPCRS